MRGIIKRTLKGKHKRVRSLKDAWKQFKTALIEVQVECIPQVGKGPAKSKRSLYGSQHKLSKEAQGHSAGFNDRRVGFIPGSLRS